MNRILVLSVLCLALGAAFVAPASAQYRYDLDEPAAQENFRLGVQAYQRGRYAEALALFEKAFSAEPDSPLVSYWLGRCYARNGFEATALERYAEAIALGGPSALVEHKAAAIRASRAVDPGAGDGRHVGIATIQSGTPRSLAFARPSSALAEPDGSVLVVAFGSNEILRIDTNGIVASRWKGGTAGFDGPYDVARAPDGYWVSEFRGDRISLVDRAGTIVRRVQGGTGDARLSGPQHLAIDEAFYLYAVDFGNSRVVRFDPEGVPIQRFGGKQAGFPGLRMPTGIAARSGRVYVADLALRGIAVFDYSGNFLDTVGVGDFAAPESLRFDDDRTLVVADRDRALAFDLETETVTELYRSERRKPRITGAVRDAAGDLVLVDLDANAVDFASDPASLYAGFAVELERVDPSRFPVVEAEVIVRDRSGRPITGLDARNFYVTERVKRSTNLEERGTMLVETVESIVPVANLEIAEREASGADVAIVVELSPALLASREALARVLDSLAREASKSGTVTLVAAGSSAAPLSASAADLPGSISKLLSMAPSTAWRLDQATRLAVNRLAQSKGNAAVVFVGSGSANEDALGATSLSDLASYCRNNGVSFNAVLVGGGRAADALRYLTSTTGGGVYDAGRPEGFAGLVRSLAETGLGRYRLRFASGSSAGFGRVYQSFAIEAYLFKKSGRDEIGYFAPLD